MPLGQKTTITTDKTPFEFARRVAGHAQLPALHG